MQDPWRDDRNRQVIGKYAPENELTPSAIEGGMPEHACPRPPSSSQPQRACAWQWNLAPGQRCCRYDLFYCRCSPKQRFCHYHIFCCKCSLFFVVLFLNIDIIEFVCNILYLVFVFCLYSFCFHFSNLATFQCKIYLATFECKIYQEQGWLFFNFIADARVSLMFVSSCQRFVCFQGMAFCDSMHANVSQLTVLPNARVVFRSSIVCNVIE